jgi:hypothetical protein
MPCPHGRQKSTCKECGGSSICEHKKLRSQCKECGGSSICEHKKRRNECKECGGSSICEHKKERRRCKECGGSGICQHGILRFTCKVCNPTGHLKSLLRSRVYSALKNYHESKQLHTLEYLGCTLEDLRIHLESKFLSNMSWDNQGSGWHIDHIKPCASFDLTKEEEIQQCFHYTNFQPLWGPDNLSKSDQFDAETFYRDNRFIDTIVGWQCISK